MFQKIDFDKNKFLLIRILDDLDQVIFSSEIELNKNKTEYHLTIPGRTLVKGNFKINSIIYHPAIIQYENVMECLNLEIIDNISEFSHLETFDIGKVYIPLIWH